MIGLEVERCDSQTDSWMTEGSWQRWADSYRTNAWAYIKE